MSPTRTANRTGRSAGAQGAGLPAAGVDAGGLADVLGQLVTLHERLLVTLAEHRTAIRRADARAIGRAVAIETELLAQIQSADDHRGHLARLIARSLPGGADHAAGEPTMRELASRLEGVADAPDVARLHANAVDLRDRIRSARKEQAVIRSSTEALLGHMNGLLDAVGRRFNTGGLYTRAARPSKLPMPIGGIDIKG